MVDRRQMVGGIGAGLAAAILAGVAPAAIQGRSRRARDGRMGYAIVGLGNYATRQIMPSFANSRNARIAALVSGTPAKLERFGAEYDVPTTHRYSYQDYDRIRDNPDIDIVYVVLPVSLHAEYSIRASQAGKHVMCEKPMAMTSAECQSMIDAAAAAGRQLMIGYRSRFEPNNVHAIELARSGRIGANRVFDSQHGFAASLQSGWRLDRAMSGGGSMMDIGIYGLNAARYMLGEEPTELFAMDATDRTDPRFRSVEDRILSTLRFPSGAIAQLVSSYSSQHNRYRLSGADGFIDADPGTPYEGQRLRLKAGDEDARDVTRPVGPREQFAGQLDHLPIAIRANTPNIVPGEEGLADIRIIEAMYRSAAERQPVRLA